MKNQGEEKVMGKGCERVTREIHEQVQKYAKSSCKDLTQLMQINKMFIVRICTVVCKRIVEPSYSAE